MTEPISLNLKDAAALVGVSVQHLRNEAAAGNLVLENVNRNRSGSRPVYNVLLVELKRWREGLPVAIPGRQAS